MYSVHAVTPVARGTLTGIWTADDLGTYYVRQIGNIVWWLGMSHDQGATFTNVFSGVVTSNGTGTSVQGTWVDVPLGTRRRAGRLIVDSPDGVTLNAVGAAPHAVARRWEKVSDNLVQP